MGGQQLGRTCHAMPACLPLSHRIPAWPWPSLATWLYPALSCPAPLYMPSPLTSLHGLPLPCEIQCSASPARSPPPRPAWQERGKGEYAPCTLTPA